MKGRGSALIVVLAALALAACGEDDGDGDGGGGSIPKQEFIEQADEVCAESAEAQEEAQAQLGSATSPDEAAAAYEELADVSQGVNEEIKALGRPEGDGELIDDLSAKQDEFVVLLNELAAAVRAEDQAEAEAVGTELDAVVSESGEILDGYGFKVC
jgi:hypothetical protein